MLRQTTITGLTEVIVHYLPYTLPSKLLLQSAVKHWMDALLNLTGGLSITQTHAEMMSITISNDMI